MRSIGLRALALGAGDGASASAAVRRHSTAAAAHSAPIIRRMSVGLR